MKGYLIDPKARRVTEVKVSDKWQEIAEIIDARFFCVGSYLPDEDTVFVDDEGLLTEGDKYWFQLKVEAIGATNPSPLCGRGLVLGADEEGNSVDPKISLKDLANSIRWVADDEVSEQLKNPTFEFIAL